MAAPSYTTDLINLIADSDITAWTELTGMTGGALPDEADTESALQGTNTVSAATNTVALFSSCRILTSPVTLTSGYVFLVWHGHGVATALLSYASGGLRLVVATDADNWKAWAVGGNDVPPYPYGKWINNPIDPTISYDYSLGTPPTTNYYGVGSAGILSKVVAKGQPHVVDIIRYGRAEARISGGESGNYATFAGFVALNDANDATNGYNRWGLIQETTGGYLWKGLMTLGYSALTEFVDSNKNIFVQDTRKVASGFNKIEIRNASSIVNWTGISFVCLSPTTTASKGSLEVIDNADVNFDTCAFTDMTTFTFQSNSTILNTTFRRCGQITAGGANFSGSTVTGYTGTSDTSALVWTPATSTDGLLDDMVFIKGTTSTHALEFGTSSPTTLVLNNVTLTGYNASDGQTDSAIYIKRTTGTVVIEYSGTIPTYKSDGATVVLSNPKTLTITVKDENNAAIEGAQVYIQKSASETGEYGHPANPYSSHASGNVIGDGDFVITQTIEPDNPTTGWLIVKDNVNKDEQTYRYASQTSSTFTFPTAVTGTDEGGGTSTTIVDTGVEGFNIVEGDTIHNTASPYQWAIVLSVTTNLITTTPLSAGGSWSGLSYSVHTLAKTYVTGDTACVPLMNEETNASGIATESYNLGADMAVDIRVRLSTGTTKYFPYKTTDTISGNLSITAVLIEDTIIG